MELRESRAPSCPGHTVPQGPQHPALQPSSSSSPEVSDICYGHSSFFVSSLSWGHGSVLCSQRFRPSCSLAGRGWSLPHHNSFCPPLLPLPGCLVAPHAETVMDLRTASLLSGDQGWCVGVGNASPPGDSQTSHSQPVCALPVRTSDCSRAVGAPRPRRL